MTSDYSPPTCGICYDPIPTARRPRIPCEHAICEPCLMRWIVSSATCPFCRRDVDRVVFPDGTVRKVERVVEEEEDEEGDDDEEDDDGWSYDDEIEEEEEEVAPPRNNRKRSAASEAAASKTKRLAMDSRCLVCDVHDPTLYLCNNRCGRAVHANCFAESEVNRRAARFDARRGFVCVPCTKSAGSSIGRLFSRTSQPLRSGSFLGPSTDSRDPRDEEESSEDNEEEIARMTDFDRHHAQAELSSRPARASNATTTTLTAARLLDELCRCESVREEKSAFQRVSLALTRFVSLAKKSEKTAALDGGLLRELRAWLARSFEAETRAGDMHHAMVHFRAVLIRSALALSPLFTARHLRLSGGFASEVLSLVVRERKERNARSARREAKLLVEACCRAAAGDVRRQ